MEAQHEAVCYGEILWDRLPSGFKPGGAPMNVAYHLQKLGLNPALISRIGKDDWGAELMNILTRHNVSRSFIQQDAEHPTGIVNAVIGQNHEVTYDIVESVAWDYIEWEEGLTELVARSSFFVFGSLAGRNSVSRDTLFKLIEAAPCKVADINLRAPHFTQIVIEALLHNTHILKLNEHELPIIANWFRELYKPEDQVKLIQDHFHIPTIVVTLGGEGALLCREGFITRHNGYRVSVEDTVGSGDAFLAGFLYGTKKGFTGQECLQFANAMGAFIATKSGACPDYNLSEVHELLARYEGKKKAAALVRA